MTIAPTGYIVHDNEAIYGVGLSADEAWWDTGRGMAEAGIKIVDKAPEDAAGNWTKAENFHTRAATAALLDRVRERGGNCGWSVRDGIACTPEEAES